MYFRKVYWRIENVGYPENAVFKSLFLQLFLDWFRESDSNGGVSGQPGKVDSPRQSLDTSGKMRH
jgi:hypothetical protein